MKIIKVGDAHIGKKFENGVPLHRRGDRERSQMEHFRQELLKGGDFNIQMGDIVDRLVVPYACLMQIVRAYAEARAANPSTTYIVLMGNHDGSRDLGRVSAFDLLTEMLRPMGVIVVRDEPVRFDAFTVIPWHPVVTAAEMVAQHANLIRGSEQVFAHYDVVMGDENQLPADQLLDLGIGRVVTGHDHNARTLNMNGLEVEVTGSMQPYSHAEDPAGEIYVTLTLDQLAETDVTNKCVRLVLEPGEDLTEPLDCLQLQIQRGKTEGVDMGQVDFEAFDLNDLFEQACAEVGLSADMKAASLRRLEEERAARS